MQAKQEELSRQLSQKQAGQRVIKDNILLQWAAHLLSSSHRCILTLISAAPNQTLPVPQIDKFKNGPTLLRELEAALLVSLIKRDRAEAQARLNPQFFTLLPTLVQKMSSTLDPVIKRLELFGSRTDLKMCIGCETLRSQQEIDFIGECCRCDLPQFQPVAGDPPKLARLTKIRRMLETVLSDHGALTALNNETTRLQQQIDQLSRRSMTPYEQFVSKHKLDIAPKQPLEMTPEEIKKAALEELNELVRLRKVEELIEARKERKEIGEKKEEEEGEVKEEAMELEEGQCEPEKTQNHHKQSASPSSKESPFSYGAPIFAYEPFQTKQPPCEEYRLEQLKKEAGLFRRQFERKRRPMVLNFIDLQAKLQNAAAASPSS